MFACWQTYGYFNILSNIVNKKMTKKALFLATEGTEVRKQRTPGRETEKPAPGVNSRTDGPLQ